MIRTGSDTDAVPTPPLIMDGTDYEAGAPRTSNYRLRLK